MNTLTYFIQTNKSPQGLFELRLGDYKGFEAKEDYTKQSCLLLHQLSHTLLSTPTLSPAEPSREPMMRRYLREASHGHPPAPQDEDEREPMFVQAHDPDYVPEPIYPEYIPLEDEHEFPAEEQPLPPVDSPTAEITVYVTESIPRRIQRSTG
ncbi:hypothetical protein Tco_1226378 [Tanacetum coccineum]